MKKILVSLVVPLLLSMGVTAQRIYFCANYTPSGDPISSGAVWNIAAEGGSVYILFQKASGAKMPKSVNFSILKLSDNEYIPFDVKAVTPDKDKSFVVLDYKFLTAGSYQVVAKDDKMKELTKEYVTINSKTSSTATTTTTKTESTDNLDYYTNSIITSGTSIDDYGVVSGTSAYYTIPAEGAYVIYKVDNVGKAINSEQLIVDVYKKNDSDTYDFYETKNYDIKSQFDWIYFKYSFFSAGDYKLAVYNKEWKYINTAYTTIKTQ
jgi:hypothetical protein